MVPKKKRSKLSDDGAPFTDDAQTPAPATPSTPVVRPAEIKDSSSLQTPKADPAKENTPRSPSTPSESNRSSWYSGTWRSKAPAVTQVAKGSIEDLSKKAAESYEEAKRRLESSTANRSNSPQNFRKSSKALPALASETRLSVTSSPKADSHADIPDVNAPVSADPPLPPDPMKDVAKDTVSESAGEQEPAQAKAETAGGGWFGWWSRPDGYRGEDESIKEKKSQESAYEDAQKTPLPPKTPSEGSKPKIADSIIKENGTSTPQAKSGDGVASNEDSLTGADSQETEVNVPSRGWFGLWSTKQNTRARRESETTSSNPPQLPELQITDTASQDITEEPREMSENAVPAPEPSKPTASKSSGWAFWSRDKTPDPAEPTQDGTRKEVGQLAVADTPSQSHPEAAQFNEQEGSRSDSEKNKQSIKKKRGREALREAASTKSTPGPSPTRRTKQADPTTIPKSPKTPLKGDLIMPAFRSSYALAQSPSYWEQLKQFFRLSDAPTGPRHVDILSKPPTLHRALAVGVHGYFPAPIFQRVIGQPTGTSIRFANMAAASIKEWCNRHPGSEGCEIEKVALEGEGMVQDRVDTLWKLLLNWLHAIQRADLILVAAHSQGVPVAVMLVAKLIQFGCVKPTVRIGILAMAGVNMGPFPDYKNARLFGSSASELFEFCRRDSKVSQMYQDALGVALQASVRISYVGAMDDQLVSLESSTFAPLNHPYIYRAVFVDGRSLPASEDEQKSALFMATLISFALKLRNLGISDHGLVRELSAPLAGSLVGGDGHSRLYDDAKVYDLAVEHALETTAVADKISADFTGWTDPADTSKGGDSSVNNPFFLPWAMRGVLEENFVKAELQDDVKHLITLFESWRPQTKVLKDVKFRLEAVRSRL